MNRSSFFLQVPASLLLLVILLCAGIALDSVCAHAQGTQRPAEVRHSAVAAPASTSQDALYSGFLNPPPSARLRCYWWWLNGHVTVESIDHDLTEMKAKGYGGVLLVDANGADAENNDPVPAGPTFGSPAWTALFLHAVETAHKLDLEIILTITSGWDLGAPFIQPKDGIKILTWSRTLAEKGETHLSQPKPMNAFYRTHRCPCLSVAARAKAGWPGRRYPRAPR